jgi:hypothetical protein
MASFSVTGRTAGLGTGLTRTGLAPGVSIVNGQFLYNGQPLTQAQWNSLNNGGFIPYQPPSSALPGTYDPSLDAQGENANLGFGFQAQDYTLNNQRLGNDFATATGRLDQNHQATLSDLLTGLTRAQQDYGTQTGYVNQDYGTQTGRLGQDYQRNTADLATGYNNLGINQAGAIRASGASEGGALAQALAKRTANQAHDQSGIDLGYQRGTQDLTTQRDRSLAGLGMDFSRYQQDNGTQVGRENQNYGNQTYDLGLNYQRQGSDLLTNYQRAGVANDAFQRQINGLKVFQAQQAGLLPEGPPNEHTATAGPNSGKTYRDEVHNGVVYHRYADGHMVAVRKVKK